MKFSRLKDCKSRKRHIKFPVRCLERVKPFLRLFKLCGVFANEITEGRLKRCSLRFYGICILWLVIYWSYVFCLTYYFLKRETIKMRETVDIVKHLVGYISLSINNITTYLSQDNFSKFYDRLECYDHKVMQMKNGRRDSLWIPWLIMLSIIAIDLLLLSVIIIGTKSGVVFLITLSDIFTMILQMYGSLEMFLMLYLMLVRFKQLNMKIVPYTTWKEKEFVDVNTNTFEVVDVKILHSILYDAQCAFNDIYNNLLLIWFASLMIHVLANVRTFRERGTLIACAFIIPPILQVSLLCAICHYTAEEANTTACVLNKCMCALGGSKGTTAKVGVLTYFLHHRVSFEAAGFFTIDLPLLQAIVASVTTYFIILL